MVQTHYTRRPFQALDFDRDFERGISKCVPPTLFLQYVAVFVLGTVLYVSFYPLSDERGRSVHSPKVATR